MPSVIPWSWSSLQSFETCPKRHKLVKITKVVTEPTSPHLQVGRSTHKALEDGVKGMSMPSVFKRYEPIVQHIRCASGQKHAEQKFALNTSFRPVDYWDKSAWVRGVLDVAIIGQKTGVILDYKTGKPKVDSDQLKLFAGVGFLLYPFLDNMKTGYVWLDHNRIDAEDYKREDVPGIWKEFIPRVKRMEIALETDNWPENPTGLCGWCPVGPKLCQFWKGFKGENR
jgi:hypothetical protein